MGEPESIVAQLLNTHDVHLVGQHSTYGGGVLAKVSSFIDATATSWALTAAFPDKWVGTYGKLALRAVVATTERWLPLDLRVHKGTFVVKPIDGTGSRSVCVVDSLPDALRVAKPGDMVELFIPGQEYSVDVVFSHVDVRVPFEVDA